MVEFEQGGRMAGVTRLPCVLRVRMCVCACVCVLVTPQQNHHGRAQRALKNGAHPSSVASRATPFQTPLEALLLVAGLRQRGEAGPELSIPCAHGAPALE